MDMHTNYMKPVDLDLECDSHGYLGNGRRASEVALARRAEEGEICRVEWCVVALCSLFLPS